MDVQIMHSQPLWPDPTHHGSAWPEQPVSQADAVVPDGSQKLHDLLAGEGRREGSWNFKTRFQLETGSCLGTVVATPGEHTTCSTTAARQPVRGGSMNTAFDTFTQVQSKGVRS
jgi:hypothetical protein